MSQYSRYPVVTGGGGSGTVTSVSLSAPSIFTVSGSPVTSSGTLTLTLANEPANTVFAGPTSGGPAQPTFRALVVADIPALPYSSNVLTNNHILVGNVSNVATDVAMSGDVSIINTGATTVLTVGGKSAASIATSVNDTIAATSANTPNTIVKRDGSGNFSAGTISAALTGNVTGNVSGTASNITGLLAIANGGTNSSTALNNNRIIISSAGAIVESAAITANRALASNASGIPVASATTDTELGFVAGVTSAIQTQLNAKQATGNYITALTGDVTATGPGSVAATVASVGGSSASAVNSATVLANNATSANTASQIVRRDASGDFSAGIVSGIAFKITGTGGAGFLEAIAQSSNPATPGSGFRLFADSTGKFSWKGTNGFVRTFDGTANTADRMYTLQDASMTLAGTGATEGGTAQTSYATGDILYASATNTLSKLAIGALGDHLRVVAGIPAWAINFDPRSSFFIYDDFMVDSNLCNTRMSATFVGTGATATVNTTLGDNTHPGVWDMATGTTSTGTVTFSYAGANNGNGIVLGGNGTFTFDCTINIATVPTGAEDYQLYVGMGDLISGNTDFTDGVYFLIDRAVSTTNWTIKTANNSTRTSATTATAFATGWVALRIVVNAAGTSAAFFINGTQVSGSPLTTNIPTGAGRYSTPTCRLVKTAGTTSRVVSIDYLCAQYIFTTAR